MTELIYITHPSVNIDKSQPPQNWGLSEKGQAEARELLKLPFWGRVTHIYSSSEPKAEQVAQLVSAEYGIAYTVNPDLGEADRTKTPFLPFEEYMAAVQHAYEHPDEEHLGWESHHHMQERNAAALKSIVANHKDQTFVIIGHGGAGTVLKCHIKQVPVSFSEDPQKTGCYFIANLDTGEITPDWQKYC